jgi:hypothetical protein
VKHSPAALAAFFLSGPSTHSFASSVEAHPRSAADPISGFGGAIVCGTDNPVGPQNILILKRRVQWITKL